MTKCINCESEILSITATKFCSRSCAASYNNKVHPKRNLEGSCKTCNTTISSSRLYCNICIKIFKSKKKVNGKEYKTCRLCKTEKHHSLFYGNINKSFAYCKECEVKRVKTTQKDFKQNCIDYKGGKCSICGYDKCNAALDFHHLDPTKKDFAIARYSKYKSCWINNQEEIKAELDKCILVCSNCHREIHHNINTGYQNRTDDI